MCRAMDGNGKWKKEGENSKTHDRFTSKRGIVMGGKGLPRMRRLRETCRLSMQGEPGKKDGT